jgi:hypothetical protein
MNERLCETTISEILPDDRNANRGTERGASMLEQSLRNYGAGRSILLDKNNRVIAGNKTVEQAAQIGLDDVVVVDSDGSKLVAVRRTDIDLDSVAGRELAIADNRTSEVGLEWDTEALEALQQEGVDLGQFWFDNELASLLELTPEPVVSADALPPVPDGKYSEQYGVIVLCDDEAHQQAVYEELQAAGHKCRVVVT